MVHGPFAVEVNPNWRGLVDCIMRRGTPERVHHIELFLDGEVQRAIAERYGVFEHLDPNDPDYALRAQFTLQRFWGYDYVRCGLDDFDTPLSRMAIEDTAGLARDGGREYMEEHRFGPEYDRRKP